MFNIVLVHPQIPQNTGAIGRMCVNANLKLHIVKPTVFDLSEKAVRRAGLDYWKILNPKIWDSLEEFLEANLRVLEILWMTRGCFCICFLVNLSLTQRKF